MSVQVCLRDILYQLIEELPFVQQGVIELIIKNFSRKTQKSNPSAFKLACDLSTLCDDKLQRYVCQYFSDAMIASSREEENEESDFTAFQKCHDLILQIFDHVPTLLLNVIPQLDEELKVEKVEIRETATETLGKMFAKRVALLKPKLMDPDEKVRVAAIRSIGVICHDHPDLLDDDVLQEVAERCKDKRLTPRLEAMQVLAKLFNLVYNL
ncbi:hypothetical protein HDU91_002299 [Kappamyces sp. JEL0680]|nr:hypothetical protein HDU91_002299 [Kappamyces sp. JEL0680]